MEAKKAIAVIPARYGSSRFPGKPLALLGGRPLIEHVFKRAMMSPSLEDVIVATDDTRILEAVEGFGGKAVMTSDKHLSGSDRLGEVVTAMDAQLIVNIQGDEPFLDPAIIDAILEPMVSADPPDISTAAACLETERDYRSPDVVKVIRSTSGRGIYFSRSPIPYGWKPGTQALRHIGIYAYLRESLMRFISLPHSSLEKAEGLEQLRALENGMRIDVVTVEGFQGIGVDKPEDLERAESLIKDGVSDLSRPGTVREGS